jgi:hypothetical protein
MKINKRLNNTSRRHHYLPRFYIKGFVNSDGNLYAYNKTTRAIKSKSPKQVYFEWNRNLVDVEGQENDFIEKLYGNGETSFAELYNNMIYEMDFLIYNKLSLVLFIQMLYNRNPKMDSKIGEYLLKFENKQTILRAKDVEGNEVSKEQYELIAKEEAKTKGMGIIKGLEGYKRYSEEVLNLEIAYTPEGYPKNYLLSDYPFIVEDESVDLFQSRFIFTLSSGIRVIYTKGSKIKKLSKDLQLHLDMLTFMQSSTYVCGTNDNYLRDIEHFISKVPHPQAFKALKKKVFSDMFD